MPQSEELIVVNGGRSEFGPMVYTQTGDYQYQIYQNSDPRDRFTYDKRVYKVTGSCYEWGKWRAGDASLGVRRGCGG